MTITRSPTEFGAGTIGAGTAVIVGPVPANTVWYVSLLDLYNAHTGDVSVQLLVNQGGGYEPWKRVTLDADGGHAEMLGDKPLLLQTGSSIAAIAGTHSVVSFVANGIEEVTS